MSKPLFKCELSETKSSLIARLHLTNIITIVPPHRGVGLQAFTNEEELRDFIKKLLCTEVDKMIIIPPKAD